MTLQQLPALAVMALAPLALAPNPAAAVTNLSYAFSQSGYSEGATVTGAFTGVDLDGNGLLVHGFGGNGAPIAVNELATWTMHFSGNSLSPAFDLSLTDLYGFVYQLGTAGIGDDPAFDPTLNQNLIEGIGAIGVAHFYTSGLGPNNFIGGYVGGPIPPSSPPQLEQLALDSTQNLVLVTQVPEPATALLFATALTLGIRRRRE
jgi:hypothetical protein